MSATDKKLFQPHYAKTTDLRVVQTRAALQKAFLKLLASMPPEKISVRQIVAAAGIGYNTFFRHYPDKDALLNEVIADEIAQLVDLSVTTLDTKDSLQASIALFEYVDANRAIWKKLLSASAISAVRQAFITHLAEVSVARISTDSTQIAAVLVSHVAASTIEMLHGWFQQSPQLSVHEIAAVYDNLVASPVISASH